MSAAGTVFAAGIAVWLYWKSRSDAQADQAARRRVLMAVLGERVVAAGWAIDRITFGANTLVDETTRDNFSYWRGRLNWMHVPGADRLFELQSELIGSGNPDDAPIAQFIETVRAYEAALNTCIALGSSHDDDDRVEVPIGEFRDTAERLHQRATAALKAVAGARAN